MQTLSFCPGKERKSIEIDVEHWSHDGSVPALAEPIATTQDQP